MPKIAISYRRSDSLDITGRIFDRLALRYGRNSVFRDLDNIRPGTDFRDQISDALEATDVLLAVVGPKWLGRGKSVDGNRIDNEADLVRIEVETALARKIPVIPVLVGGAKMPATSKLPESIRQFAFRHAMLVDGGRDFDHHVDGLVRSLDEILNSEHLPPNRSATPQQSEKPDDTRGRVRRYALWSGISGLAVIVAAGVLFFGYGTLLPIPTPVSSNPTPTSSSSQTINVLTKPSTDSKATPSAKDDFKAALARKDYDAAFALAGPLAAGGDRDTQFGLAWLYDKGLGINRDLEQAAAWYRKAAEQGHPFAQLNLGAMYEYGSGVSQSYEQAFNWYRKAAEQGDAEAQNNVGVFYAIGQGTRRDDIAATLWYEKAAKQGFAKAQKNLGDMWATGRGVKRDDREALRMYYQAAEQNHPTAEFNIGYWYENGMGGVQRDYEAAAQWYRKAAQDGSAQGQEALDRLRNTGRIKE